MGEQNVLLGRLRHPTKRAVFVRAAEIYQDKFGLANGSIPASFEIINLTGWAPHESQQKPLRPGSARTRLASAVDSDEITLGKQLIKYPVTPKLAEYQPLASVFSKILRANPFQCSSLHWLRPALPTANKQHHR